MEMVKQQFFMEWFGNHHPIETTIYKWMFQVPGHQTSTTKTGYLIYLGFQEIDERLTNFLQLLTIWARVDQLVG